MPDGRYPKSKISTMPGCRIDVAERASLKNRSTISRLFDSSGSSTLTAAALPSNGCSAR
ncbi:MAG: hypothetical protein IPL61_22895 [Myxococcales bacterium]|nr:hypothetical protein [Myxococcales bacterium]